MGDVCLGGDEIGKSLEPTLDMLLKKANVAAEKFCEIYKIACVPELSADKYADAVKKLETAIKSHKEDK